VADLGITVKKLYWRRGIGREMMKYLTDWAKQTGIIRKINLSVRNDNVGAINLYKQFGFIEEGTSSWQLLINGKFYDTVIMGLKIE